MELPGPSIMIDFKTLASELPTEKTAFKFKPGAKAFLQKLYSFGVYTLILYVKDNADIALKLLVENELASYFTIITQKTICADIRIGNRALDFSKGYNEIAQEIEMSGILAEE